MNTQTKNHGNDGKGRMVLIATLFQSEAGRNCESYGTQEATPKVFEDRVVSFADPDGTGDFSEISGDPQYRAFVAAALGGTPTAADHSDVPAVVGNLFHYYSRPLDNGGERILKIVPALWGETEEQVTADPAAARRRATDTAEGRSFEEMLAAMGLGGGLMGLGAMPDDEIDDEIDDEDDDEDDEDDDEDDEVVTAEYGGGD